MYRSFYNLKFKPFQISSDPAFLWLGEKHREALATLRYGIMDNKGFLLLTGDVGMGKTTLINTLIASLGKDVLCASVPDPYLEKIDFYNFVARKFGADHRINSKGDFIEWFTRFLHKAYAADKKVLLIIDEAQLLTQEMLEEIRLLSNVEIAQTKLLNVFLVGQNELNETLSKPINRAVRQRLTLNYNIEPLGLIETAGYIEYRLHVAGTDKTLFTPGAVREIHANSLGLPRRINVLCDHALLTGFVKDKHYIDQEIIRECARELDIPVAEVRSFPVPPVGNEQSPGKQPDAQTVQSPGAPHEERQKRRFLALTVFVLLVFFIAAGAVLFSDYARTVYVRGGQYLTVMRTEVTALLSAPFSRQPDQSVTLGNSSDIPLPGEQVPVKIEPVVHGKLDEPFDLGGAESAAEPVAQLGLDLTTKTGAEPMDQNYLVPPLMETEFPFKSTDPLKPVETIDPEDEAEHHILPEKLVVRFNYNNNDFTEKALEDLSKFADDLLFHPNAKISIKGYTDSHGNQAYNQSLSQFRANIVKSFLLGKGADSDQIETLGMGGENPIVTNDTVQGRMMNRRVEIEVVSK